MLAMNDGYNIPNKAPFWRWAVRQAFMNLSCPAIDECTVAPRGQHTINTLRGVTPGIFAALMRCIGIEHTPASMPLSARAVFFAHRLALLNHCHRF
jgi:hypothetical protein